MNRNNNIERKEPSHYTGPRVINEKPLLPANRAYDCHTPLTIAMNIVQKLFSYQKPHSFDPLPISRTLLLSATLLDR